MQKNLNSKGMLLVEALLAVVILASGITLVVQSLSVSRRNVAHSLEVTQAVFILENHLTRMLESKNGAAESASDQDVQEAGREYMFTQEPVSAGIEDSEFLKEIKTELSWKSGSRKNNLSLNTYSFIPPSEEPKQN